MKNRLRRVGRRLPSLSSTTMCGPFHGKTRQQHDAARRLVTRSLIATVHTGLPEVVVVDATRCHRLVLQKEFVGRFVVSHRLHAARLRPGTQTGGLRARAVVPVRRYVRTAPTM